MSWDPAIYLQYEDARLRPALDLLARVPQAAPAHVVDLGCGAGNVTRVLATRWPAATIVGVDGDDRMLAKARALGADQSRLQWVHADLARWRAEKPPDLIYSNAALHWLDHHAIVFPRLLGELDRGGVLAVQMPDNFAAPSHVSLFGVAKEPRWKRVLADHVRAAPVAPADAYAGWLDEASALDIWTTEYLQVLPPRADGEHAVVAWMLGAALTPFLAALDGEQRAQFVDDYRSCIAPLYPARADGTVLFPFRRIFMIAKR